MEIVIEKLKKEDLKEAISIYDNNYNVTTNMDKLFHTYDQINNNSAYHNIVAKLGDEIVGLATIIINYDIVEELKPFITVWNFCVKEKYRRNKIGTKMFEYIYQFAKDNDCDFISLTAENNDYIAQSFYESLGYRKEVGYFKIIDKKSCK